MSNSDDRGVIDESRRAFVKTAAIGGAALATGVALDALFQYSHEQGFSKQKLSIEELFHPSTLELVEKG